MTTDSRICLECGDKLMGRSDQKFCTDQCRNTYNNRNNCDANNLVRNINNALRKNRRILDELNPGEKIKTSRERLLNHGFNFKYFTHQYVTKSGTVYLFCYEMGYLTIESDEILIVRKETEY